MRILIAAPPKAGNSWLKCLLASIYDLEWLRGEETPKSIDPAEFAAWAEGGGFRDDSIFHLHYDYSEELCRAVEALPAHLVTIIRDPYDAIVSLYHFVQAQAAEEGGERERRQAKRAKEIVGKPIDHPDTIAFLDRPFRGHLLKGQAWIASGRSVIVRYEDLHGDPMAALTAATARIAPAPPERIAAAVAACTADTLRQERPGLRKRIRSATVGDWRNHLTEVHLALFREKHGDLIRQLGYEVH